MISIKNSYFKVATIILTFYIIGYSSLFLFIEYKNYQVNLVQLNSLELQLQNITKENRETILKIQQMIDEIAKVEKSYLSQDKVESKLKRVFLHLSFKYKLSLVTLGKLAINHYIIVAKVHSKDQEVIENFAQILSNLGKVKQSEKNHSILYIDYIMEKSNG